MVLAWVLFSSCMRPCGESELLSINLIDRNGFSETVSAKERLDRYRAVDFLDHQPYEKVVRLFSEGDGTFSCITSYHPNGELHRYLEVRNGRALGSYREYDTAGELRIEAQLIGGAPDIDEAAQASWLFDGVASAWDERGNQIASIPYRKGELDGLYTEYHPSGAVAASLPYQKGKLEGVAERRFSSGGLAWQASYAAGQLDGFARSFWPNGQLAAEERFRKGRLEEGRYYSRKGQLEEEVVLGSGFRIFINGEGCKEVHQVRDGVADGTVKEYGSEGQLIRLYQTYKGEKSGEEIYYDAEERPKLSIQWSGGEIYGEVKSWYPSGQLESRREMAKNRRNGVSTAWYPDGSLMMIEEYRSDRLLKGEYYRKGGAAPVSRVSDGAGVAMVFDSNGLLVRRVNYCDGEPDESH